MFKGLVCAIMRIEEKQFKIHLYTSISDVLK